MDPLRLGQSVARVARSRLTRRAAFASSGAGLAGALLGRVGLSPLTARAQDATPGPATTTGDNLPPNVPAWMRTPGAEASPYGERSPYEDDVVRELIDPFDSWSPLADIPGTTTPNALWYEVHYGGIPAIDPSEHRLLVHGLVERPTLFTVEDLKRFPAVSVVHFLECSGNSFPEWTEASMGQTVQQTHGLTSCGEWTGVPVATILREVGIKPGGAWVLAEGADAVGHDRSIPTAKLMSDALLAYAVNGEDLRPSQGYPAAPAPARLRGQHQRQVAAAPEGRRPALADPAGNQPLHRSDARWDRTPVHLHHGSQVGHHRPLRRATPRRAGLSGDHAVWPGRDAGGSPRSTSRPMAGRPGLRRRCRSRCCRSPGPASACRGRGTASPLACKAGPLMRRATCSRRWRNSSRPGE